MMPVEGLTAVLMASFSTIIIGSSYQIIHTMIVYNVIYCE